MVPHNIKKDHIEEAIKEIDRIDIPPGAHSTTYDLEFNGKKYPPKLVISLANKFANGEELPRGTFYGGPSHQAFKLLEREGFKIVAKNGYRNLKEEFVQWFFKNANGRYSTLNEYTVSQDLDESNKRLDRDIFNVNESNYRSMVDYLQKELYKKGTDFDNYSKGVSHHRPRAILGKENYLKFLREKFGDKSSMLGYTKEEKEKLKEIDQMKFNETEFPLNKILYGPPGTGKTYKTKELAVRIANPGFSVNGSNSLEKRKAFVEEYDLLFKNEQIVFTTFHQSFGYEDFVEGIKPSTTEDKKVIYDIAPGVFKKLCDKAKNNWLEFTKGRENGLSFDDAFDRLKEEWEENENLSFPLKTQGNDYKIIGFTESSIQFEKASGGTGHTLSISTLRDAFYNRKEIRSTGVGIYYPGILNKLKSYKSETIEAPALSPVNNKLKNYVLIIDEINRGNVSGIFGELITLLESDKRMGQEEEIIVELPYSKELFSVPPNIFVIGTMNTADRSVEALDTALRRRFAFEEVMPKTALLDKIEFDRFNLEEVLQTINKRIEALIDRDHTIGHSYFIKISSGNTEDLKHAFVNKIIPLLQEYFYNDYEKIALILGEGFVTHKEANVKFAKFKNIDQPELGVSFELKKIDDIEEAIHILLNLKDEERE